MTETACTGPITADPTATDGAGSDVTTEVGRAGAVEAAEGWQALALAVLDRELTGPEVAAVGRLPADVALDLLFPDLDDAARHEALWALDRPPA